MYNSVKNWMKEWTDFVNKPASTEDFWLETPFGNFKNPKFIPSEIDSNNEINITVKYDIWEKYNKK